MAHKNLMKAMPTLLTSIGIFGTFLGIVLALVHFDSAHLRENIDKIIDGMQTAFVTSVLGVFLSLILKISMIWVEGKQQDQNNLTDISNQDILDNFIRQADNSDKTVELLNKLGRVLHQDNVNLAEHLSALRQLIVGQNNAQSADWGKIQKNLEDWQNQWAESQLIHRKKLDTLAQYADNHLGSLKNWQNEWQHENIARNQKMAAFEANLKQQLDNFAEILSKSATEQIIDALRQVIHDFNERITEQFGDNFKQLNEAVGHLLVWQENYKNQLNQMSEQYAQAVTAITQTEQSVAHIAQSSATIPQTMSDLDDVMRVNQHQIDELSRHLETFKTMRDKAVQAVPEIQQHIENVLNDMKTGSQHLHNTFINVAQHLDNTADYVRDNSETIKNELAQAAQQFANDLRTGHELMERHIQEMQAACNRSVTEAANHLNQENQRVLQGLERHAENALQTTGESLQRQMDTMNNAVQNELEQITVALGTNLLSMINRFTEDYQKLVDKMKAIVEYNGRR